jgi:selenide, water dikinase
MNSREVILSEPIRLTSMAKAAGCAAKMHPGTLESVLRRLPPQTDPNVLVGFNTNDDAGIYLLNDSLALVQTIDFFTPIVDDPFVFGQIAAANALSDVYAMGGRPISALSVVGFPDKGDPAILEQIMRGGLNKMMEANCSVIGGHSLRNEDVQFGYAVTGLIDPKKVWKYVGAQPEDILLFTKPLGTGVISTALKNNRASQESMDASIASMTRLNRITSDALRQAESHLGAHCIHAVTDVTGFSLLGHAREMALGDPANGISSVSFVFQHSEFNFLPGALQAVREGFIPGGLTNNRNFIDDCVDFTANVSEEYRALLFDPQSSGGLLVAVAPEAAGETLAIMQARDIPAKRVGRVLAKTSPLISVL